MGLRMARQKGKKKRKNMGGKTMRTSRGKMREKRPSKKKSKNKY
jgi:hypothetical protein